ncbi:hypothetical protein CANCADRAFT_14594, partial [Tortispora caseinolytica NRRL Y-17796]
CGLEIHTQLNTRRKLFAPSSYSMAAPPNSTIAPFDLALPGTEPILNYQAVYLSLLAATALNCTINNRSTWDRKHYLYADQPAGYQITQHFAPLATNGQLVLPDGQSIRISELHIEQDTAKTTYMDSSHANSYIDFNRSNHPLIEIVTQPDFTTPEGPAAFVQYLQLLFRHLGVSTGELESGAMRVDVNVSVGNNPVRTELKNISTLAVMTAAIKAEWARQCEELDNGREISFETRGFDGTATFKLRDKDTQSDYRYMSDPELPPLLFTSNISEQIRAELPELPMQALDRLLNAADHQLREKDAHTLIAYPNLLTYYNKVHKEVAERLSSQSIVPSSPRICANWILNSLLGIITEHTDSGASEAQKYVTVEQMADLIVSVDIKEMTPTAGKKVLRNLVQNPGEQVSIKDLAKTLDVLGGDDHELELVCREAIASNPEKAEQVAKKPNLVNFFIGMVMKTTKGRISADKIKE